MESVYITIPVNNLQRGRYQPRFNFDQKGLDELAQSILKQGLIEPLIVREVARERYEIIAGERRWRAAMLAGLQEVPCLLGNYSDAQAAAVTLVENIQRQQLTLIEEAQGYRRLCDEFHFHQEEIAILVSKSRSHVANILRLLTLCTEVQQSVNDGKLSFGHARVLVGLPVNQQIALAQEVIEQEWSVRVLEEKARILKTSVLPKAPEPNDKDIERLQIMLSEQIGAPVQITSEKGSGGWLQIKFFDNDTLAGLLERMRLRYD